MIIKGSKTHVYQIRKVVAFFRSVEIGRLKKNFEFDLSYS